MENTLILRLNEIIAQNFMAFPLQHQLTLTKDAALHADALIVQSEELDENQLNEALFRFVFVIDFQRRNLRSKKRFVFPEYIIHSFPIGEGGDYTYPDQQLITDLARPCEIGEVAIVDQVPLPEASSKAGYLWIDTQKCKTHFLIILREIAKRLNENQRVVLLHNACEFPTKQILEGLALEYQTNDPGEISDLRFVAELKTIKIHCMSGQAPVATIYSHDKTEKTKINVKASEGRFDLIAQQIHQMKTALFSDFNYYAKISGQQYVIATQSDFELALLFQGLLNKHMLTSFTHVVPDHSQIPASSLGLVFIALDLPWERLELIMQDRPNIFYLFDVRQHQNAHTVLDQFEQKQTLEIAGYRLTLYIRANHGKDVRDTNGGHLPISSNVQFKTIFSKVFDVGSEKTQLVELLRVPAFKPGVSEQVRQFSVQFLEYLNVFFKFTQESVQTLFEPLDDTQMYEKLKGLNPQMFENREYLRRSQLKRVLSTAGLCAKRFRTYLDIGCADGILTVSNANLLQIPLQNTYGVDARNLCDGQFNFRQTDFETDRLPFNDAEIDVVTVTQVLHHVHNYQFLLKEIQRVLTPGGLLIIRESLWCNEENAIFLDIQHGIYACCVNNEMSPAEFVKLFEMRYISQREMESAIRSTGLAITSVLFDGAKDKFQKCWFVCEKTATQLRVKLRQ